MLHEIPLQDHGSNPFLVLSVGFSILLPQPKLVCFVLATIAVSHPVLMPHHSSMAKLNEGIQPACLRRPKADHSGTLLDLIHLYSVQCFEIILYKNLTVFFSVTSKHWTVQ